MFGSSPPFNEQLALKFSQCINGGKIGVLYLEREGAEAYLPNYWKGINFSSIYCMTLKEKYKLDELNSLKSCQGVIIGGGHTEAYRSFIVDTELGSLLKELYREGIPIAGFSAGALICPEICVISPNDNEEGSQLLERGLGLVDELIISAHYLEWNEEANLEKAIERTEASLGIGIAEYAGVYLLNNKLSATEGYIHIQYNDFKQTF
ncbi:Type 1 glutamine amidotransferase-like domain-containing protein [Halobacillus mangrovi]|uniref:Type 1 glutamine amidotransferase-like domain-containing protein n=1 Tax=Halobacillus mangrovi TaxID=402384 RepID=UPI003D961F64